jgi:hypothetical protein
MKTILVSVALLTAAPGIAAAQAGRDTLIVSGQLDVPAGIDGGNGGVEWLRETAGGGLQLGGVSGSRGDAWWTYGRAGGFVRRPRAVTSGLVEVGGGSQGPSRFQYQRVDATVTVPVIASRAFFEAEGQVTRMAGDMHEIVRLGVKSVVTRTVTAGASAYAVVLNGSVSPAVSARVDVERRLVALLGGFVIAREQRAPTLLTETVVQSLTSEEVFAGIGLGTSYRLQIVANVSPRSGTSNRVLMSLRIPLRTEPLNR